MSKALKQLVVVAAVVAISMVFIIQFRPGTNVELGSAGPRCAVEIAGDCIPHSDFVTAYRLAAPNLEADQLKVLRLRQRVVEGLIERYVLLRDADRLGITVSDQEVSSFVATKAAVRFSLPVSSLETLPFMLSQATGGQIVGPPVGPARFVPAIIDPKTKGFDYDRYQKWVVRGTGKTEKDFKEYQKQEALAARMRALVKSRVRISEEEAFAKYAMAGERAVVDYVKLDRRYYRDHVVDLSAEAIEGLSAEDKAEVDESWEQRKDQFTPVCRKARQLLIRIDETNPDREAATAEARKKIEAARARIEGGDAFADVARELSQDGATASQGGQLGCFAPGKLMIPATTKAIDDAVYAMKKGAMSEIIETDFGFHLLKLDAVLEGADAQKHGWLEVARELYAKKEAERLAAEGAKQILAAVKGGKTLAQALHDHLVAVLPEKAREVYERGRAAKEGDEAVTDTVWTDPTRPQVKKSDPFPRAGPAFGGPPSPDSMATAKMLYELDKPGAVPDDIIDTGDGYVVAQFVERQGIDKAKWEEERDKYIADLRDDKERDALIFYLQELRNRYAKEISIKVPLADSAESPGGEG
jgi:peptidyl-prolyl cis-trans isomerase D